MFFPIFSGKHKKGGSISGIFQLYSYPENTIAQKQEVSLRGHHRLRSYIKGNLRPYLKGPWTYILV